MHSPKPTVQVPRMIRMRAGDNVAIVANDRGLPAGARIADGPTLLEAIPQGHKVALCDIPEGGAIVRYGVVIGHATKPLPAGSWVYEAVMRMPPASRATATPTVPWAPATSWPSP